jgi:hypothetical protein
MRREQIIGFAAVALVSVVVGHGIAAAQAQTSPPPDASAGLSRQVTLSPAEQLAQSSTYIARMDGARTSVRRQLETARSQRDVVKTLCLNDKLNQIDVAIRSARERRQGLELAVNRRDADLSNHEFTILTVLRQRTEQLTAEANQCIGQEAGFIGDSAVTATIDPNLPKDDPSEYPVSDIIIEPPACSSCFR